MSLRLFGLCFIFIIFTIVSTVTLALYKGNYVFDSGRYVPMPVEELPQQTATPTLLTPCNPSNSAHDIPCSGASSVMVHVYALPPEFEKEITSEYRQCEKSQWAFEVHLPRMFRRLPKMKSPDNADFYLVPFPVKCYNNFVALYDKSLVDKHFTKLIHWLNVTHPWFQKSGGGDHIFIFPSGQGSAIFPSSERYTKNSIYILAEGDRSRMNSNAFKDVIVPGFSQVSMVEKISSQDRELLAVFRGQNFMHVSSFNGTRSRVESALRTALIEVLQSSDGVIATNKRIWGKAYENEVRRAKFLLCPRGITPWTRRVFDAILMGAVPVIISDDVQFPFEAFLDWSLFTVKISEARAIEPRYVEDKLRSMVSSGLYEEKVRALRRVRSFFDWTSPKVMDLLLCELDRRKRLFKHGSLRTWDQ
jgi:hypothetical protein